jgi:hypothetical protein
VASALVLTRGFSVPRHQLGKLGDIPGRMSVGRRADLDAAGIDESGQAVAVREPGRLQRVDQIPRVPSSVSRMMSAWPA